MDVALGRLNKTVSIQKKSKCNYTIQGKLTPTIGMPVKKCSRTTELQKGIITDINVSYQVEHPEYPNGKLFFKDQIEISIPCLPGDSGSILVENSSGKNKAVGLIFAGNKTDKCLANNLLFNNTSKEAVFADSEKSITDININFNL